RFNGALRVVLPDVRDRLLARYPVQHGEAGQRGPGPSDPAAAGDLDALGLGARPGLAERVHGVGAVGRQPEVRPAQPSRLPGDGRRFVAKEVGPVRGCRSVREWAAESPAADEPARWQSEYAHGGGLPRIDHGTRIAFASPAGVAYQALSGYISRIR